jgi:NAD(P)H-dependent FMN reductase
MTTMTNSANVLVIIGSTRARRICPQIAAWVAEVGREATRHNFEVLDLKDWPLPMDDEPGIPAAGEYAFEHTRRWSRKISEADAVVFVSPQYNWGYPAPLKNALDHLYKEWSDKPAMIVTYGGHGGSKCADQLRQILEALEMRLVPTMAGFRLTRERIEANAATIEPAAEFAEHTKVLLQAFAEVNDALAATS